MLIKCQSEDDAGKVGVTLARYITKSRFTCRIDRSGKRVKLSQVRLLESKPYCGSHPGACVVGGQRHARRNCLEGADWIGLNEMVNDVLDILNLSADVASIVCIVRKGPCRRIRYDMFQQNGRGDMEWYKDGGLMDYEDCRCRDCPKTEFPEGTPGLAEWRKPKIRKGAIKT